MIVHKDYIIYRRDVQIYVHSSKKKKTTAPKATIALSALYVQQSNEMRNLFEKASLRYLAYHELELSVYCLAQVVQERGFLCH